MKIRKFNEEVSHLDDETSERLDGFRTALESDVAGIVSDLSSALEEYTTNVSSEVKVHGFVPTDEGEFEFTLTIKRIN